MLFLILKSIFVLDVLVMLKKGKVNFKTYDATDEIANNYNTHISQYLKK